ncbi:MAG: hypothetical protein IT320_21485 [Anaerolineae bacterium]|nr:hypothetical protein [Anaerolineae bacterium]
MSETKHPAARVRRPVLNRNAPDYLLLMVVAFGVTVVGTRAFLQITGFPQLGNETFHIAHALWGGLLLLIGGWLMLMFANRWIFRLAAVAAGAGVGLFIDEVGKFITQTTDYFFPLAAPIIYAAFLITVFVYLVVRRPRAQDARAAMYTILEDLQEVLDRDLNDDEREALLDRLSQVIADSQRDDLRHLAEMLRSFIESDTVPIRTRATTPWDRLLEWLHKVEVRWLPRGRYRMLIVAAVAVTSIGSLIAIAALAALIFDPQGRAELISLLIEAPQVTGDASLLSYLTMIILEAIGALLMGIAAVLYVRGNDLLGSRIASLALVVSLTLTNVLGFYFDQFAMIATVLFQLGLLLAIVRYQQRFALATA